MSTDHQAIIGQIVNSNIDGVEITERQTMLVDAQKLLRSVLLYTEPASTIYRVCDHPPQIITLQRDIMDIK